MSGPPRPQPPGDRAGGRLHRPPAVPTEPLAVLTPPATVAAIRAGYVPQLHPSAVHGG